MAEALLNIILRRLEQFPSASFRGRELRTINAADFDRLCRQRWLCRLPLQPHRQLFPCPSSPNCEAPGREVLPSGGKWWAVCNCPANEPPIEIRVDDLTDYEFRVPAFAAAIRDHNKLQGKSAVLSERLTFVGEGSPPSQRVALVFALLDQVPESLAILAGLPSQLPAGFSRILVLTPTFTPHPIDAARLERMNIFVATGIVSLEFELPFSNFDTMPGQKQDEICSESKSPAVRSATAQDKSWTQPDLNAAIREYKASRASTYQDLVEGVRAGRPGAKKEAQKLFGRNAVARALQVKARAMVTKSPEWQAIAEDLRLPRGKDRNRKTRQKIGLDIAIEDKASEAASSGLDVAVQAETIRLIQMSLARAEAEPLIERLQRGDITDDQVREIVSVVKEQKRDDRGQKVRSAP